MEDQHRHRLTTPMRERSITPTRQHHNTPTRRHANPWYQGGGGGHELYIENGRLEIQDTNVSDEPVIILKFYINIKIIYYIFLNIIIHVRLSSSLLDICDFRNMKCYTIA